MQKLELYTIWCVLTNTIFISILSGLFGMLGFWNKQAGSVLWQLPLLVFLAYEMDLSGLLGHGSKPDLGVWGFFCVLAFNIIKYK